MGHHLTDPPLAPTDSCCKVSKSEEALIHKWILVPMSPEIRRDISHVDYVKELLDDK